MKKAGMPAWSAVDAASRAQRCENGGGVIKRSAKPGSSNKAKRRCEPLRAKSAMRRKPSSSIYAARVALA
jgi:hypothetical protein